MTPKNNTITKAPVDKKLIVSTVTGVQDDLQIAPSTPLAIQIRDETKEKAKGYIEQLLSPGLDPQAKRNAIDTLGAKKQHEVAYRSEMLKEPIRKLGESSDGGNEVAKALMLLTEQFEMLNPSQINFSQTGLIKLLGRINHSLARYFLKYQSAETVVAEIVASLRRGKEMLLRDNRILANDQEKMRELNNTIADMIELALALIAELENRVQNDISMKDEERQFVSEELLFPLHQRAMDLQQSQAVCQQGIIATELIIRNNRELVRGVDRAIDITVSAFQIAVAVSLALANQKIVLKQIQVLNTTTNALIAGTAKQLHTQATEIHKTASSSQLDPEMLKQAFVDLRATIDEINTFRRDALPGMASQIDTMYQLSGEAQAAIDKMDRGNTAVEKQAVLNIE